MIHAWMKAAAAAAVLAVGMAGAAQADATLSGEEIRGLVSGNTIEGTMLESGAYAEFYGDDGTIRGDGYTGQWTIDGDSMCFQYGEDPAGCWQVTQEGETLNWLQDGDVLGDGMVVPGNPNNF